MDIEVYQNINCGVPPQDNKYWAQHKLVGQFAVNPRTTVPPNSVTILTQDRPVLWRRRTDIKEITVEDIDGATVVSSPMKKDEIERHKEKGQMLLSPGTMTIFYSYRGDCNSKSALLHREIIGRILIRVLPDKTIVNLANDTVNDILVNGNKIAGCSTNKNDSGIWDGVAINLFYDRKIFERYLSDFDLNKVGRGITGLLNENPNYSTDSFIQEFVDEFIFEYKQLNPAEEITIRGI